VSKFTQRHYVATAEVFWTRRQELGPVEELTLYQQGHLNEWTLLQKRFVTLFSGDNSKFRQSIFDRACGLT
jgi:hypothetical protein